MIAFNTLVKDDQEGKITAASRAPNRPLTSIINAASSQRRNELPVGRYAQRGVQELCTSVSWPAGLLAYPIDPAK